MKKIYQTPCLIRGALIKSFTFTQNDSRHTAPVLNKLVVMLVACSVLILFVSQEVSAYGFNYSRAGGAAVDSSLVTGVVKDKSGPLPGVSVNIKGSRSSTMTDYNGRFSLNAPQGSILVFSFVGYVTQEVSIDKKSSLNVTMAEESKNLQEVVVIGYGTQSREKVIGSVSQVSGEQIASRPVTQLKNALTGQMPGVSITQRNGSPGVGSGAISIRGVGSFGASPNALILVDGVIIENFNDIDPNDVDAISVLKDASSAAIYGSRAANGVILVTTKSGKSGAPKLSYNAYAGLQKPTVMPEYVNSWEYQQAFYEARNQSSTLSPDELATVEKFKAQNDPLYPNNNFLDLIFAENALQTSHNVSINGGLNSNKYNISMGYLYQDGLIVNNNYSRYNLRSNVTTALSSKFTLTTRLAAIFSNTNEPMSPPGTATSDMIGIVGQTARTPGIYPIRLPNGDYGTGLGNAGTPVSFLESKSFYKQKKINLNGSLRLDYNVLKDLKLSFLSSYIQNNGRESAFRSTQRINSNILLGPNTLTESSNGNSYYNIQGLADYSKQLGKHFFSVLGGYSFEDYKSESLEGYRVGFPSDDLPVLRTASPEGQESDGTGAEYALESQFGRATYSYDNKYLVEGVVRRDGSSRFPTSLKYAVFPSVAAGWRIGEERFIKNNFSWINELKLKASWGVLGNQNISNYPYQNTLASSPSLAYSFGGVVYQGATRTTLVDNTLHWESTRTKDLGLEVGALDRKVNFSATYFDRYTYNILYAPNGSVSNVLGFSLSEKNTGKLKNTGWEFTAGHNNKVGNFSYNVNGNFTIVKNRVLDLGVGNINQPNGLVGNGSDLFIGYPNSNGSYSLYYGYVADGLFVDAQDVIDYETANDQQSLNANPKPGDIRYKDISGPNGVPDGVVNATYDRIVLGSQIPKYSYGINLGGGYKGLDLNILLQGISGVSGRLSGYGSYAFYNTQGNIQRWQYEGRWTEQNPNRNAIYPRVETVPNTGTPNTLLSSFWVQNGSYLRVKNVQLGYNLSKRLLQNINISNARIYLSGDNLHTFSSYVKGWDPEINGGGEFYPITSTYTLGLNVTF